MFRDFLRLAVQNLTHRKMRSWLTMIGIFIGIAAVVSLISLGQGMQQAIYSQFVALGSNTVTVQAKGGGFGPPGTLAAVDITDKDLAEIQRIGGVDRAFGRLVRPVSAEFNDQVKFIFVASLPSENEDREFLYEFRDMNIQDGRMLESGDTFKVMIGNNYNENPVFGRELYVGNKVDIEGRSFDIVGVLERTGSPEVNIAFFMNEDILRDILDLDDELDLILAKTSDGDEVATVADSIRRRLRNYRDVDADEEDFTVETSEELLESFSTIITIVQIVLVGIAGISLLVGGVGITNTMYTAVLERTKEIGIMKAIGARNSDILLLFLIESGMLGMAGGTIGILIGIGLSKAVEFAAMGAGVDLVQAHFPLYLILGALAFSFGVGSLAGLTPARKAAMMDPVEALRK